MRLNMKFGDDSEHINANLSTDDERIRLGFGNYIQGGGTGIGLPPGGNTGDMLLKASDSDYDAEWVAPANAVEADNTLPITSAAVYTEVGNINALLATI